MRVFNPRERPRRRSQAREDSEKTKEYSEISPNRYDFLRWIEGCDSVMPSAPTERSAEASAEEVSGFEALQSILARHQRSPDSLIEVLNHAQETYHYLSDDLLRHVARNLGLPLSQVFGTASFYHLFRFQAPARHNCTVCTGTACSVIGAGRLVEALEQELGIRLGSSRADGSIDLGSVRCLGTCGAAPLVVIDGVVAKQQTVASVLEAVRSLR
ncbi:bidirectional [NiFe] hydrogenase diaphorase subunit [Synechococcus sp. Ace-Pa]|nr:bidirectional [NiFe] hydrogenase diaphorase subunit [Synechococcus sp. Ace-Pa]